VFHIKSRCHPLLRSLSSQCILTTLKTHQPLIIYQGADLVRRLMISRCRVNKDKPLKQGPKTQCAPCKTSDTYESCRSPSLTHYKWSSLLSRTGMRSEYPQTTCQLKLNSQIRANNCLMSFVTSASPPQVVTGKRTCKTNRSRFRGSKMIGSN
jgi:hypothetical protein